MVLLTYILTLIDVPVSFPPRVNVIEYTSSGSSKSLEEVGIRLNKPLPKGPMDLVPGLIPSQGIVVVAGETHVGKTLIALEMISAFTTGKPLWGELVATKPVKKVLYFLGEHNVEVVQDQLRITNLEMPDDVFIIGPEQFSLDKYLINKGYPIKPVVDQFIRWADGCDLLIFDPLTSFVGGVDVENDNVQMRTLLETISYVGQSTGAPCIIQAHQGKPMMNQFGQETKRKSYAIRGASAIEDASTNIFYLSRGSSEAVERETGGEVYELIRRKYKGSQIPPKYTLLRNKDTLTHTLISDRPFEAVRKLDLRAKAQRFRDKNPKFTEDTIIDMLATGEGVAGDTIRRWMGLLID